MGSHKSRTRLSDFHFQVFRMCWAKLLQSSLALGNPVDHSPPGSPVHVILQARILEWGAISYSRGSSWARDGTCVSLYLLHWPTGFFFFFLNPWHHLGSPDSQYRQFKLDRSNVLYWNLILFVRKMACCNEFLKFISYYINLSISSFWEKVVWFKGRGKKVKDS